MAEWRDWHLPVALGLGTLHGILGHQPRVAARARGLLLGAALVVLASAGAIGCFLAAAYRVAEPATASFHQSLNQGQFQQIYDAADPQLRAATSAADFRSYLAAVHRKLGRHLETKVGAFNVHSGARVTRVSMKCSSRFEEGEAQEEFLWLVEGTSCRLASYTITSRTLVVK